MVLQLWEGKLLLPDEGTPKPVANHANCCCGGECNDCSFTSAPRRNTWIADLGVGGMNWVDADCGHCDQVKGQYTLTRTFTCTWEYNLANLCFQPFTGWVNLQVYLENVSVGGGAWKWRAVAILQSDPPWHAGLYSDATYESGTSSDADCWDLGGNGVGSKITLSRTDWNHIGGLCTGTPPATIQVWSP